MHMQPSEVDRLTTYEFNNYLRLLNDQIKSERERENSLAQAGVGASLMKMI